LQIKERFMINITIIGQGAMGARVARRLTDAGQSVTTWNRTGATQSPRDAVADADIIIAMVRDDEASRAIWLDPETGVMAGMKAGALAIESSTLSVAWVKELAAAMVAADRAFIDAPVVGSRPQAEAGQLIHLIGGAEGDVTRAAPVLSLIGAAQHYAGAVGSGTALKLIVNTLFGIQVAAVAELIRLAKAMGLDSAAAFAILNDIPVMSPAAKGAAALMLAGNDSPMFPIELVAKDFGYAVAAGGDTPMITAAAEVYWAAAGEGYGARNITGVVKCY
jgi:3-hydroxyisobutyrate dehydrogenase